MKRYVLVIIILVIIILIIVNKKVEQKRFESKIIDQHSVEKYNIHFSDNNDSSLISDTIGTAEYSPAYFYKVKRYANFRLGVYAPIYNSSEEPNTPNDNFEYIVNSFVDVDGVYRKAFIIDYQQLMANTVKVIIDDYIKNGNEFLKESENFMYITYFDYYSLNMYNYIFCNLLYLMVNEIDYPYDIEGVSDLSLKGANGSANFTVDKDLVYQNYNPQYKISNDYILSQNEILLKGLSPYILSNDINLDDIVNLYKESLFSEEIAKKFNYTINDDKIYLTLQSVITFVDLYEKYKIDNNINLKQELDDTHEYLHADENNL